MPVTVQDAGSRLAEKFGCIHATGLYYGCSMAEDGFALSGGLRGIYSALDVEVAFRNARKIQHDGKWFKVVVQNLATCDRGANSAYKAQ